MLKCLENREEGIEKKRSERMKIYRFVKFHVGLKSKNRIFSHFKVC